MLEWDDFCFDGVAQTVTPSWTSMKLDLRNPTYQNNLRSKTKPRLVDRGFLFRRMDLIRLLGFGCDPHLLKQRKDVSAGYRDGYRRTLDFIRWFCSGIPMKAGKKPGHLLLVAAIILAEKLDQLTFFPGNGQQGVARDHDIGQEQGKRG